MKTPIVFLDTLGPQLLAAAVKLPSEISSRFWSDVENFSDVTSLCFMYAVPTKRANFKINCLLDYCTFFNSDWRK